MVKVITILNMTIGNDISLMCIDPNAMAPPVSYEAI